MRTFRVELEGTVTIELHESVIDAVDEEWEEVFFKTHGAEDVAGHIAWNMVINRLPLSRIDGWANQPDYKAKITDERWTSPLVVVETTMP